MLRIPFFGVFLVERGSDVYTTRGGGVTSLETDSGPLIGAIRAGRSTLFGGVGCQSLEGLGWKEKASAGMPLGQNRSLI